MEDKIQSYRQPLVTATGIILGFILNFASTWVKSESLLSDTLAYGVAFSILLGTICLLTALYRILDMSYPKEEGEAYYGKTLRLFITGLGFSFAGVMLDMFANFMID